MLLSSVLESAADRCEDDACCALFREEEDDDNVMDPRSHRHLHCAPSSFLTYRGALHAQNEHAQWLQGLLNPLLSSGRKKEETLSDGPSHTERVVYKYVAYLSPNHVDLFLSVLACSSLDLPRSNHNTLIVVPTLLNTRWTTSEMVQVLRPKSSEVVALVYSSTHEAQARQVAAKLTGNVACAPLPSFSHKHFQSRIPSPLSRPPSLLTEDAVRDEIEKLSHHDGGVGTRPAADRDAVILFTSGTSSATGAKGVRLSHRALLVQAWAKLLSPVRYSNRTVLLATTVPFFHVGGLSSIVAVWMAGGCLVLPESSSSSVEGASTFSPNASPSFEPHQVFQSLQIASVNTLVVVPAMLHALMTAHHQEVREHRDTSKASSTQRRLVSYPHVKCVLIGGQSASESILDYCRTAFPNARIVQTYACTEAASSLTFRTVVDPASDRIRIGDHGRAVGDCVGTPPPHVELAIGPVKHGDERRRQEEHCADRVGVIVTRGPHVMNGYWDSEAALSKPGFASCPTLPHYDWHVTGDLGRIDEHGQLWFCGRISDSIRTGGETVMAGEVERVLLGHPRIADVAVFALPDDKFGQAVACAIVLRQDDDNGNAGISVRTVREWCQQNGLAGYKRPRKLFAVTELPKNSSGKTLKYLLVERFSRQDSSAPRSKL